MSVRAEDAVKRFAASRAASPREAYRRERRELPRVASAAANKPAMRYKGHPWATGVEKECERTSAVLAPGPALRVLVRCIEYRDRQRESDVSLF